MKLLMYWDCKRHIHNQGWFYAHYYVYDQSKHCMVDITSVEIVEESILLTMVKDSDFQIKLPTLYESSGEPVINDEICNIFRAIGVESFETGVKNYVYDVSKDNYYLFPAITGTKTNCNILLDECTNVDFPEIKLITFTVIQHGEWFWKKLNELLKYGYKIYLRVLDVTFLINMLKQNIKPDCYRGNKEFVFQDRILIRFIDFELYNRISIGVLNKVVDVFETHFTKGNNFRQRDIPEFERKIIEMGLEFIL